ncbi:MAG: cell division protein SepF [bacterium]|nr:cell division protein SepF [bacterium]
MANMIKNLIGYLKLNEDEDYDDGFDEQFEEQERERAVKAEKEKEKANREQQVRERGASKSSSAKAEEVSFAEARSNRGGTKVDNKAPNKIVPIRTTSKGLEVCIMKPSSFEDSQDICDMLLSGRASVVNLEGFDPLDAQRIMDFISGCVYAINGKLHQISKYIFIFSPDSIDISGDYLEFMPDEGFEVPTLNKDF